MSTLRRAAILKLASSAYEMNLDVMNGAITQDQNGHWLIGGHDLTAWLQTHTGKEVVLVLGDPNDETKVVTRTCRTCGRDYTDVECPHCRANRIRLRGHA